MNPLSSLGMAISKNKAINVNRTVSIPMQYHKLVLVLSNLQTDTNNILAPQSLQSFLQFNKSNVKL